MKRYSTILAVVTVMVALSIPVLAMGPRAGQDGRNPDCPRFDKAGGNPGCPYYDLNDKKLSETQLKALKQVREEFTKLTTPVETQLREKMQEMGSLLNSPKPDEAKIWALQKQTTSLRDQLDREWIRYNLKVKKAVPDARIGQAEHCGGMHGMFAGRCHGPVAPEQD
jgi:Spy/CpxP family protein refolding chaperone